MTTHVMMIKLSALPSKSKTLATPVARIVRTEFSPLPRTSRHCLFEQYQPRLEYHTKTYSSTTSRQPYASVDETFKVRQPEREADEVDVCIVGGGITTVAKSGTLLT